MNAHSVLSTASPLSPLGRPRSPCQRSGASVGWAHPALPGQSATVGSGRSGSRLLTRVHPLRASHWRKT